MTDCQYCKFTRQHYLTLRLVFPISIVQAIHNALCVEVIDASAEMIEQRIVSGKPTLLLAWHKGCKYSAESMPVCQRFAQLSSIRVLRADLMDKQLWDSRPLIKSLRPNAAPNMTGMAHGHIIRDPTKFENRNLPYLLEFAARFENLSNRFDKTSAIGLRAIEGKAWFEQDWDKWTTEEETDIHWIVENVE